MKRVHGSEGIPNVECINPRLNKYKIRIDYQPYFDQIKEEQQGVTYYELNYPYRPVSNVVINDIFTNLPDLNINLEEAKTIIMELGGNVEAELKNILLHNISLHDTSSEVNSFSLNGANVWLNKETRVGLMNSTQIEKAAGHEDTTLWLGTVSLTINCDLAIQMLSALELYALECFNKTAEHKANVEKLKTVDEIVTYNYKVGYPEKLVLNTESGIE